MPSIIYQFTWLDLCAVVFFLLCWNIYGFLVDSSGGFGRKGLVQKTHAYRIIWARELVKRSNRVSDTALIGNLVRSVSFYANTTIYVIAGLFALLGTLDRLVNITSDLPFAHDVSRGVLEAKVLLMLTVFVVAYFKFTWSLRQFSLFSIMVGAAPDADGDPAYVERHIDRMAKISTLAGDEFNRGLRTYYFAIASVTWAIHPVLLMAFSAIIVYILLKRDFYSHAVRILSE
jgi:uncharacterized membrane protein